MEIKKCMGCGEILQYENPDQLGYVPQIKYILDDNIICKRCYRLKNYGQVPQELSDVNLYKIEVNKAIKNADVVLSIFDVIDFEASLTNEIVDLIQDKKVLAVLNKIDLLPDFLTITEIVNWFKQRIYDENVFPENFAFVSAKKKKGLNSILKKIKSMCYDKKDIKVCVIGASNVGKSSVLNILIGNDKLTVSKYSGTTKKKINTTIKYKDSKITFIDTPGLIPNGRISDLLPNKKAVKLTPNTQISRKTVKLNSGQYFMFSNLMYFRANEKMSIQVFASKNVQFHITNENKVNELMKNDFFDLLDENETKKYLQNEFVTENIKLDSNSDLYIAGLGFIIQKKGDFDIDITYPKNVCILERPSICKKNQEKYDSEDDIW